MYPAAVDVIADLEGASIMCFLTVTKPCRYSSEISGELRASLISVVTLIVIINQSFMNSDSAPLPHLNGFSMQYRFCASTGTARTRTRSRARRALSARG
jgi:hypothetical protein